MFSLIECPLCHSRNLEATASPSAHRDSVSSTCWLPLPNVPRFPHFSVPALPFPQKPPALWLWAWPSSVLHPNWSLPMQVCSFPSGWKPSPLLVVLMKTQPLYSAKKGLWICPCLLFKSFLTPPTMIYGVGGSTKNSLNGSFIIHNGFLLLHTSPWLWLC